MGIPNFIYLDHQASTPIHDQVLLEMQPFFSEIFANPHSSDHVLGWKSSAAVETAAQQIAILIGADEDEIIFTSGATESNNLALLGLARKEFLNGVSRNRILISSIEHKCILTIGRVLKEQYGFEVESIPVDGSGQIVLPEFERQLADDVLVVSIMAVNNEIGTIQNISQVSDVIRQYSAIFHCDAAQAPVALDIQNYAEYVDLLSLSGHKMYGPKGIGALYIRRDLQENIEPIIYGGGQQNGLRSGTLPTPLCVGMGAAAKYLSSDRVNRMRNELRIQRDAFLARLSNLPWLTKLYGPENLNRHPGNISIGFSEFDAKDLLGALQPNLAASTGSACTSGVPEPSHVLKAIGLTGDEADSVVRFSLGFETSEEDIEIASKLIREALSKLPRIS